MKKWDKLRIVLIALFVLIIILIFVRFANSKSSRYTTYTPFTGCVFNISEDDVDLIQIQSGSTGELIDFSEEQEIHDFIERLNSFRSYCWVPNLLEGKINGWSYRIIISFIDESESFYFGDNWVNVNGIVYYDFSSHFGELTGLF